MLGKLRGLCSVMKGLKKKKFNFETKLREKQFEKIL